MNRLHRLLFATVGLIVLSAPLFAEENDELLRPMIVRSDGSAPPASSSDSSAPANDGMVAMPPRAAMPDAPPASTASAAAPPPPAPMMQAAPVAAQPMSDQSQASVASADAPHLRLPPTPSLAAMPRTMASAPIGRNIYADFGPPSGSVVSDRVFQLRDESLALRRGIDQNTAEFNELRGKGASGSIQYHSTVAAITARLEAGTTRGNPVLLRQWSEAEQSLSEVNYSISRLNVLQTDLSANSAMAAYLLQAVRATFELSGAVDEDHQQLSMIRDEVSRGTVEIDHMRNDITKDIQRQTTYLALERQNLQTLALAIDRGELMHNSLAGKSVVVSQPMDTMGTLPGTSPEYSGFPTMSAEEPPAYAAMPAPEAAPPPPPVQKSGLPARKPQAKAAVAMNSAGDDTLIPAPMEAAAPPSPPPVSSLGQLLVLVRFNQDTVDYEQQLYQAVSDALDRKPSASFTVVAVAPKGADPASIGSDTESAQRHADAVKSSLLQLGLQPNRIATSNISSEAAQAPEVHVYIR
ncbi:MAG: hypothetical protein HY053_03445 [Proteobacteria bacterium]|nr:hypothetical protein [Pseudomonadota bacterium]